MKKSGKLVLMNGEDSEQDLREHGELLSQIRENGLNDLENIQEDLLHLSTILASVQQDYRRLWQQNQEMKSLLMTFLKNCYCWEGNRCERCRQIYQILMGVTPTKKADQPSQKRVNAAEKYKSILQQLRKP